jgi:hypothetical protein
MPALSFSAEVILPLALLMGLAIVLPQWLARRMVDSMPSIALNMAVTALILLLFGAATFLALYAAKSTGLLGQMMASPLLALGHFLKLGLMPAILWLPVLIINGLTLAQKVDAPQ